MRWIGLIALLWLVPSGIAEAASLEDDMKLGTLDFFRINRTIPAVQFGSGPYPSFHLEGDVAAVWIKQKDNNTPLGGAFKFDPIFDLNTRDGKSVPCVIRFSLGCMFVSRGKKEPVILDWQAVREWEKAGGYKKKGMPKKNIFRARVNIVTPRANHSTL